MDDLSLLQASSATIPLHVAGGGQADFPRQHGSTFLECKHSPCCPCRFAMLEFLAQRPDFAAFACGGAWAMLARSCFGIHHFRMSAGWDKLGIFAMLQALLCWCELAVNSQFAVVVARIVAPAVLMGSLLALAAYDRLATSTLTGRAIGWWVLPVSLLLGLVYVPLGAEADDWIWTAQGFPVCGMAATCLWSTASQDSKQNAICLYMLAAGIAGFAVLCAAFGHFDSHRETSGFYGAANNFGTVLAFGLPLIVLAMLGADLLHWRCIRAAVLRDAGVQSGYGSLFRVLLVPLVLGLTWMAAEEVGRSRDAEMRSDALLRVQLAAGAIPQNHYAALKWTIEDLQDPGYQELKEQLMSMVVANPDLRYVIVSGYRNGASYFVADSVALDSSDYSPPGDPYHEASPEYLAGMASRQQFVIGPVEDRWGEWIIASVPLPTPDGADPINLEIDIAAADWNDSIFAARAPILLISVLLSLLMLFYSYARTSDQLSMLHLVEAKEAAESASRAKGEFLAVMSHEIRTPLGGVISLLDLMRSAAAAAQRDRYLVLAQRSAATLLHILDDILDAAKVESGMVSIEAIEFTLDHEIAPLLEAMQARAEAKSIAMQWHFADDIPATLVGDPTRLRQILANLLSNAIKFTATGGVSVHFAAEAVQGRNFNLVMQVRDTGIGINAEVLPTLFGKFVQADVSTTRQFGGTGLGLSIVKGLTERMGGSIAVSSKPGIGTEFTVTLPLLAAETAITPAAVTGVVETQRTISPSLRILYADDDAINREIMAALLQQCGLQADFAENGLDALTLLQQRQYDVVFMDNRMPVMDGFQATRAIRDPANGVRNPHVCIVAVTANASNDYRSQCLEAGMNDYLVKPLQLAALQQVLEQLSRPAASAIDTPVDDDGVNTMDITLMVAPVFLQETPLRLDELQQAIAANDLAACERIAHTFKGSAGYVGADSFVEIAARMEAAADAQQRDALPALLDDLRAEFANVSARLRELLSQAQQSSSATVG